MDLVISIVLFAIAIAYVEYRLKSVNQRSEEEGQAAFDRYASKKELKEQLQKMVRKHEEDIAALNDRIEALDRRTSFQPTQQVATPPVAEKKGNTSANVFYFRWPDEDGTFIDEQRLAEQSEETYYQFRINGSGDTAEFRFVTISDTQISKANNSSKKYIERACSFVGMKSNHYNCVPGTAHLTKGRWLIDCKARIEFL